MPNENLPDNETPAFRDFCAATDAGYFEGQWADWMTWSQDEREWIVAGRLGLQKGPKRGTSSSIDEAKVLTEERKNQHGDWLQQSKLGYRLKETMKGGKNYAMLEPYQREALDMIATKISRILSGDAAYEDHWDDIAGYAYLGKGGHGKG